MIMLLNKLFGWDYVQWKNTASDGIARCRLDGDGNFYFYPYSTLNVLVKIPTHYELTFLTCPRSKYIKE